MEAVREAIVAVAGRAVRARLGTADEDFASVVGAGFLRDVGSHGFIVPEGGCGKGGEPLALGPGAGVGTFVSGFGVVVEAEGFVTGLTHEGEEVELVAVGVLAVGADEGGIAAGAGVDVEHLSWGRFGGGFVGG